MTSKLCIDCKENNLYRYRIDMYIMYSLDIMSKHLYTIG